jgi:hypothetical protein
VRAGKPLAVETAVIAERVTAVRCAQTKPSTASAAAITGKWVFVTA